MSGDYDDYRYVRRHIPFARRIDVWHEMLDNTGSRTLCDIDLDNDPFRDPDEPPDEFQHQRGTGFPPGRVCEDCDAAHQWATRGQAGWVTGSATWEGRWPPPSHAELKAANEERKV